MLSYLTNLTNDAARFPAALAEGQCSGTARATLRTTNDLNAWIDTNLSQSGRRRLVNACSQREGKRDTVKLTLQKPVFKRIALAAKSAGLSVEAYLDKLSTQTSRRVSA